MPNSGRLGLTIFCQQQQAEGKAVCTILIFIEDIKESKVVSIRYGQ